MRVNDTFSQFDYLIVGAGPGGLQLGYYLEKKGRNYLILEQGPAPGTFFAKFPRHRKLISINKVYTGYEGREINLRWDWNSLLSSSEDMLFKHYNQEYFPKADDFRTYLATFATHFGIKIKYGVEVIRVTKDNDGFWTTDQQGNVYSGLRLIITTGVAKPYIPPIPGVELCEKYTEVSVHPQDFRSQRVLVIGKGNSAFETADNLVQTAAAIHLVSPNPVQMAWKTHFVGSLRAVNNNILDTYQLKSQNAILDASIDKIERKDGKFRVTVRYTHAHGEVEDLSYDRVILCTGFRFDDSIFDESCRPELALNNRFPKQTSEWESTNIKDLYFAGTLMQMRDYKKTTSGFIHGFRYNVCALGQILDIKYHGAEWPNQPVQFTPESLVGAVIQRVNTSSALWQQFGFLCDMIAVSQPGRTARYYQDIPVDYVHSTELGQHDHYYVITLEYGPNHAFNDPFNVTRIERNDVDRSHQSNFLHPVVRRFSASTLVSEHHIIEDLAAEWLEDVHIKPLLEFFYDQIREAAPVPVGHS